MSSRAESLHRGVLNALPGLVAVAALVGCGDEPPAVAPATAPEGRATTAESDARGDSDPRLDQALALIARTDVAAGRRVAEAVLATYPGSYRARFVVALGFHKDKRYDVARRRFEEIVAAGVTFAGRESVDHFLGWALYNLGRLNASRDAFKRHLTSQEGFADSHFGLGLVELETDRLDEAQKHLEIALKGLTQDSRKRARAARVGVRLADVHIRRMDWKRAAVRLQRALAVSPELSSAKHKLALVQKRLAAGPVTTVTQASVDGGPSRIRFTSLDAATTGLDVVMTSGRSPSSQILEVKGGGLGLIDHDGDGDLDVFIPNGAFLEDPENGPGCRLFENLGGLRFRDVTRSAGLMLRRWSFGVAVADYDGDGRDDIHVACYGPNVLLRNRGDGTFEDVSARAGIAEASWGTGCAFGDLDGDGDLDLYVCNYLEFDPERPPRPASFKTVAVLGGPIGQKAQHDVVFENRGDGTFRDVSESWGFRSGPPAYALNVAILDVDLDARQDVFVANDSMACSLFSRARGPSGGRVAFREIGLESGVAYSGDGLAQASMGIAVADINGSGFPDLFTTNFSGDSNTLLLSAGGRVFDDRTRQYGLGRVSMTYLGWACAFADLDHDGDEDLLVVNGHVFPQATLEAFDSPYEQTPLLFERRGGRFVRLGADTAGSWLDDAHRDRTAAFADLDGDGDLDAVVGGLNEKLRILRNDGGASGGNWLIVEVTTAGAGSSGRAAIGARVEIDAGGRRQRRWIVGGGPFQSSGPAVAHFGLGGHEGPVTVEGVGANGKRFREVVEGVNRRCRIRLESE